MFFSQCSSMPDIDWVWSVESWPSLLLYGTTLKLDFMNWLSVNYWLYRRIYYSVYLQYLPGCFSANFIAENCPGKLNILDVHLSSNVSCTLLKCRIRQNTAEYQLFPDRYYLLSTHIEFSQIFKTLQIQIEFGVLKLFRNSKSHNSE